MYDKPIAAAIDAPAAPRVYTAIATDGSQIPLDRHAAASCYVINVGEIAIHYGTGDRPHLFSNAELFFKDSDLLAGNDFGFINEQTLGTRRTIAECEAARKLIVAHANRESAIALMDGTLILWAQEAERDDEKQKAIAAFMGLLNDAQSHAMPIAGYLSRPGSREVVNALRVTLCTCTPVACNPCAVSPRPCDALNRLTDAQLFRRTLGSGQRSGLFESKSKVIDSYEPEHRIAFYYINVGSEIARVEVPMWVARSDELLHRTHALIMDQAAKGQGYPITLLEAHEQAIVRGPEREAFQRLVESALIRSNLPITHSRKSLAKRYRTI